MVYTNKDIKSDAGQVGAPLYLVGKKDDKFDTLQLAGIHVGA